VEYQRDYPVGLAFPLTLMAAGPFTKENLYRIRFRSENTIMVLVLAAVIYGYLHLQSCRSAEVSYRSVVAQRLKAVCG